MQFDAHCVTCLLNRQANLIQPYGTGEERFAFLKEVMNALVNAPQDVAAPYMVWQFDQIFSKYWGKIDHYAAEKQRSNQFMLQRLPNIRQKIANSPDPLLLAMKYAQTGNYIDFGALSLDVNDEKLDNLLDNTPNNTLDMAEYQNFCHDLSTAKSLVYLGDNAGEIVADVALVEVLKQQYPNLSITFVVRGAPVLNDVTYDDAAASGMDQLVPILDNGTAIPGTEPGYIGQGLKDAIANADVILSKGQGNFETFFPSNTHTYYMFLCKCQRFTKMFNVPPLTGIFCCEEHMPAVTPYW